MRYPALSVEPIEDHIPLGEAEISGMRTVFQLMPERSRVHLLLPDAPYAYVVSPEGLCGCYFEHQDHATLEAELQEVIDCDLRSWVSTSAYPELEPRAAARRLWERRQTAVTSLGRYLSDHGQDGSLMLYVVWAAGEDDPMPALEQQIITPAFFEQAQRLALPAHMLFTIVPEAGQPLSENGYAEQPIQR